MHLEIATPLNACTMDKARVYDKYSDSSYDDSEPEAVDREHSSNLKQFRMCLSDRSDKSDFRESSHHHHHSGIGLTAKVAKSKTFTIENILGLEENTENDRTAARHKSKQTKNLDFFRKPTPISPTDLRHICRLISRYIVDISKAQYLSCLIDQN